MDNCPTDIIYEIIKYNNIKTFLDLCLCNKQYNSFYHNDVIWKNLCCRDYIDMIDILNSSYLDLYKFCFKLSTFRNVLNDKNYHSVKDLYLTDTIYDCKKLQIFSDIIVKFPNLTLLSSVDDIKYIPDEICKLTNLRVLNLTSNCITDINPEIGKLINLEKLVLSKNQIRLIPKTISKLTNLNFLDLSDNLIKIKDLNIYDLVNLRVINLENNKISTISEDLKKLTNLEYINLSRNKLHIIPPQLIYLTKLQYVNLRNIDFKSEFITNNMKHINIDITKDYHYNNY